MADEFGAVQFPVAPPRNDDQSVTDPALDKIGSYLQAVLNNRLNAAWGAVAPNTKFVQQFFTNNPTDSTFNDRDLPALFLWRSRSMDDQLADDYLETITDVVVLWIPTTADQFKRSLRDPIFNGFQKATSQAINVGRDPAWVDPLDPDSESPELGSVLMERAGLFRMPYATTCKRVDNGVKIDKGSGTATYPAYVLTLRISEVNRQDPSVHGVPSKLDSVQTSGSLVLESILPIPPPPVTP
jgi:hypothetical protein